MIAAVHSCTARKGQQHAGFEAVVSREHVGGGRCGGHDLATEKIAVGYGGIAEERIGCAVGSVDADGAREEVLACRLQALLRR